MNFDEAELCDILRHAKRTPSGCLEYDGPVTGGGYGHLPRYSWASRQPYYTRAAHRMVMSMLVGRKLRGRKECALHTCDNRKCIEPEHLFLGTYSDNAIDREQKGRGGNAK